MHSPKLCRRHFTREQRVFGKILEIPAVQRISVDVHTGTEQGFDLVLAKLQSLPLIQLLRQFLVKAARQTGSVRHCKRNCTAVHPYSARAVRTTAERNLVVQQPIRHSAKRTRRSGRDLRRTHSLRAHNAAKLLIRQLCHKVLHRDLSAADIRETIALVPGICPLRRQSLQTSLRRVYRSERCLLPHKLIGTVSFSLPRLHTVERRNRRHCFL